MDPLILIAAVLAFLAGVAAGVAFRIPLTRALRTVTGPAEQLTRGLPAGAAVLDSLQELAKWAQIQQPSLRSITRGSDSVTLMFTDIEGSTRINEALGDERWLEFLREHHAVTRACIAANAGLEVKVQGDGFMIAFATPQAALDCAMALHAGLDELPVARGEVLRVRIGAHTGSALEEEGDLYGRTVALAARLTAFAAGGETVVSADFAEQLEQASREGLLRDLGHVSLDGISGKAHVFSLDHSAAGRADEAGIGSRLSAGRSGLRWSRPRD